MLQLPNHMVRVVHRAGDLEQLLQLFALRVETILDRGVFEVVVAFERLTDVLFVSEHLFRLNFWYQIRRTLLQNHLVLLILAFERLIVIICCAFIEVLGLQAIVRVLVQFLHLEIP